MFSIDYFMFFCALSARTGLRNAITVYHIIQSKRSVVSNSQCVIAERSSLNDIDTSSTVIIFSTAEIHLPVIVHCRKGNNQPQGGQVFILAENLVLFCRYSNFQLYFAA